MQVSPAVEKSRPRWQQATHQDRSNGAVIGLVLYAFTLCIASVLLALIAVTAIHPTTTSSALSMDADGQLLRKQKGHA